jgi:hypothetical protein
VAITVPNVVKVTGSGVTTVTTSGVTTTTGSTFTISSTADFGVTINTPTDSKSNAYGALGTTQTDDSNAFRQSVFYKENGAGGSGHTATVTYSGSTYPTVYFTEVRGAATASYDSGSLAAAFDNNGSPHDVTSGTFAQANNAVLTWIGTDGGGTRSYSCSGFTVTQETDGNNYWTGATGYKLVTATTAQLASWVESATRGLMKIVAFKEAAGGTSYDLTVDPASYSLTAAAETVTATRALTISPASYALTAASVNLAVGRAVNFAPASYTLTAAAETLTATRALSIDPASYSLTNSAVTLSVGRVVSVDPVVYTLTTSAETLTVARQLNIVPAAYALTAADVTLEHVTANPVLSVDPVSYVLSLPDVSLEYVAVSTASTEQLSYSVPSKRRERRYNYDYSSPKVAEVAEPAKAPVKAVKKAKKSIPADMVEMLGLIEASENVTAQVLSEQTAMRAAEQRQIEEEQEMMAVIACCL